MNNLFKLIPLLALWLAACAGGSVQPPKPVLQPTPVGTPIGAPVSKVIGIAGGNLASADGKISIEIPEGALSKDETVSIQEISNESPAKFGKSFRLGPEGVKFAKPVRLSFRFTAEELRGTALELIRIAYQTKEGYWSPVKGQLPNLATGTVTIETDHFSSWSPLPGAQLNPWEARVKVGGSVKLQLEVCEEVVADDPKNPLDIPISECAPSVVVARLAKDWKVNGALGGNSTVGTVNSREPGQATYTAPAKKPTQNPVGVSVEYTTLEEKSKVILLSNITVEDDAGQWAGSITFREEGSRPWAKRTDGFEGSGEERFSQNRTYTVVGAEETAYSVTLLLNEVSSTEYTDKGHLEKKVYEICHAFGPTILRHHFIYDVDEQHSGEVSRTVKASLSVHNGEYTLDLGPTWIEAQGQRKQIDLYHNGCAKTTDDYSYTRPIRGGASLSSKAAIEGPADSAKPGVLKGNKSYSGERSGMPTQATITWDIQRGK